MNEIAQPHDRLFKALRSHPETAGDLSPWANQKIADAALSTLEEWNLRILDATTLESVLAEPLPPRQALNLRRQLPCCARVKSLATLEKPLNTKKMRDSASFA
ncbi:MAG: Rpn family recombination-promoting nuclease/putative transposase [Magnetococcus sp. YQC-3]